MIRKLAVVVLSILLVATLFGATVTTGVERTALDEEYVEERFEDEEVSAKIGSDLRGDVATGIERSNERQGVPTGISVSLDGQAVANRTVTDGFVTRELNRNTEAVVAYLRGETDELELRTDLREIKARIEVEIIDGTVVDTPQLIGANTDRISAERVGRLTESEQAYRDARLDLSSSERAEIEAEMERNLRKQLSDDSEELVAAILSHQRTVLDGLTGEMSYDEYREQIAADERQIKAALAEMALGEIPDERSLLGTDDPESELGPLRSATGLVVVLRWLLPLLAVGSLGAVFLSTRSFEQTATVAGIGLGVSGLLGAVFGYLVGPALKGAAGLGSGDDPILDGLDAVVDGTLQTVGMQSMLLAVVGFAVLLVVGVDRRGLLDELRRQLNLDTRG